MLPKEVLQLSPWPSLVLKEGAVPEEGAGGTASGLWPHSLSTGFLLEPSPSWAVREKRGYWLQIPNINQTLENSRR